MNRSGFDQKLKYLPLKDLRIDDPFWNHYKSLVPDEIIPYQYDSLRDRIPGAEPSHCIRNLRIAAGLEEGEFQGFVFQDSDLAKWLEAVAYSLSYRPDPELEKTADEMIDLLAMAQRENGYLNSYFTIRHPGKQYCNLKEGHELYTAGHFIEAAVAYYQVTGKDRFLKIMCACADHICRVFRQEDYLDGVPGHEEIELALFKLAEVTGNDDYRAMAYDFINRRGTTDYLSNEHKLERFVDVWFDRNRYLPQYGQAHLPVREQRTAEGHAVRALYLYSAMADLAGSYGDEELLNACRGLYENIVKRRMYITGGVGSSGILERFTTDFDLPNDTTYSESCASIALAMFCRRMSRITGDARYMDTAELALYNTVLAGVALDGKSFFYVNPLEVIPSACLPATDKAHVQPVRQKWFGCACCPPNIARTLASLGEYLFFESGSAVWINMFVSGAYRAGISGTPVNIRVSSKLPYEGAVSIAVEPEKGNMSGELRIRLPGYAEEPEFRVNSAAVIPKVEKGYAVVPINGDAAHIELHFKMPPRLIYADPRVAADAGKCAVKKGPIVYCLEEMDNGQNLAGLLIDNTARLAEEFDKDMFGGTVTISAKGWRLNWPDDTLYSTNPPGLEQTELRFIPYCFWGNRKPGEMTVWVRYAP